MLLLCFGYGYVARRLAGAVQAKGGQVLGTTRDGREGSLAYAGDITPALAEAMAHASHILISIPPHANESALAQVVHQHAARCRWLGYLSTTGVYGDRGGGTVDESTPPAPLDARGEARLQSERQWLAGQAHCFRLAGIYGPGRSAFDAIREGRGQVIAKPGHLSNRIHVADIVRALEASMQAPTPGAIYNIADDLPAPPAEVMRYAYALLGRTPPNAVAFARAELSPMARSFYAASRRVDASKIKRYHGLDWIFPTYRQGLAAILQEARFITP